jgi:hypothetical protein
LFTPVILAIWEAEIRRTAVGGQPRQLVCEILSQKKKKNHRKRASGVTQVAEHLPSKCEALSSNPTTAKNQTNKRVKARGERKGPPH